MLMKTDQNKINNLKHKTMIRKELYEKTINILIDAYHKDTLVHGNCYACAVGNIIAANCGYKFEEEVVKYFPNLVLKWVGFKGYEIGRAKDGVNDSATFYLDNEETEIPPFIWKQIESTGYNIEELVRIEAAFEYSGRKSGDRMFNGLMTIVDVLDKIHENNDSIEIKKKFNKTQLV